MLEVTSYISFVLDTAVDMLNHMVHGQPPWKLGALHIKKIRDQIYLSCELNKHKPKYSTGPT